MKYRINKENYHRLDILEINKYAPRSYFIPFEDRTAADSCTLLGKRYASKKVRCLNGRWDFKFYPRPADVPDELDTETVEFDTLDVPSCWQFRGYDRPFYVNTRYQFPFDPPHIPKEEKVGKVFSYHGADLGIKLRWQQPEEEYNFVGVYRLKFSVSDVTKQRILSFLGVASCVDVYLNGEFAGYSEGSHNSAEFLITPFLREGENELVAVVHRWCTGTYLECQDMFRNSGIFRDVLLYELNETDILDVCTYCKKKADGYMLGVYAAVTGACSIRVTLQGHGLHMEKRIPAEAEESAVTFDALQVRQWTAETPDLYDLYVEIPGSCVKLRVGFKDVTIEGRVFRINGQKLKLKGVNHHDTSCINGYYLTPEEIQRDVQLCKDYNIDTIRTSHYPPDPLLLELCDEMGIYVIDEADLETHGCFTMQLPPNFNTLTNNKKWQNRYLDRVERLWKRDQNHTCIIMWSLGNEAGGFRNTDAMYAFLRNVSNLPVHYEGVIHTGRVVYDVGSEMYPSVAKVTLAGQGKRRERRLNDRPYFMCEYAHAMGVGPGAMEKYWEQIYAYDALMGGCVWEMVDHAVLEKDGGYTYGGDHGEWAHDGNFCVDGIFYPDRSPSTGARIVRFVYRPIRLRHLGDNRYEVFNTMAFTDAAEFEIKLRFSDGRMFRTRLSVPPMEKRVFRLKGCEAAGEWVTAIVSRHGHEVSREQLLFGPIKMKPVNRTDILPDMLELRDGVVSVVKDGKRICASDPYTILFRAPTDNDKNLLMQCPMEDFLHQREEVVETKVSQGKLTVKTRITTPDREFLCTDVYEGCTEGVYVTSTLRCVRGGGDLPRFGKAFRLSSSFDRVRYQGRNGESYRDMKDHTQIAAVNCGVADMTEPNIRPQESGNRMDCTWVRLSDGQTQFSLRAVEKPFELGVKPYSDRELLGMRHRQDEQVTGTYVTLSAFQMGIGTGSCGPDTLPEYRFRVDGEYVLKFVIG